MLFGPPHTVWADLQRQRPGAAAVDYVHLVLGYEALRVILHAGAVVASPGPRFTLHGDRGSLVKYGLDPQEAALKRGERPAGGGIRDDWGRDPPELYGLLTTTIGGLTINGRLETLPGSYASFYRGMAAAITIGSEVPVPPEDAAMTIRIIEAAMQSAAEGVVVAFATEPVSPDLTT